VDEFTRGKETYVAESRKFRPHLSSSGDAAFAWFSDTEDDAVRENVARYMDKSNYMYLRLAAAAAKKGTVSS